MKKLINVFLVAAVVLFSANNADAQQKLGHLNSAAVLQLMPEVKTASTTLQAFQKTKQDQIDKMTAEAQTKYEAALAKQKTISEANKEVVGKELQQMDTELQDLSKRIQDARAKAEEEVAAKENELFTPIQKKATDAINAVAKEKGFAYVFDLTIAPGQSATVIYAGGGEDITELVKAKLGIPPTAKP